MGATNMVFVYPKVIFTDIKACFADWKTDSSVRECVMEAPQSQF